MLIVEITFWCNIFAIFYSYLGYTGILWCISLLYTNSPKIGDCNPSISLVISVYNEEDILPLKLENSLSLDYPVKLLEIVVISDGSTDSSNEIIESYSRRDIRFRPYIFLKNKGKTSCLNDVVPSLDSEIVLFSDANCFYDANVIKKIVRSFADKNIGFVTGSTKYYSSSMGKGSVVEATSLYTKLEKITKTYESKIGSCVGADGAIFAIRSQLYAPLRPQDMNDFGLPLNIIQNGHRGILDPDVFCSEETATSLSGEFRRQTRITNRTIRAISKHAELLNPFKFPLFSFELFSHKLIRFFVPFFMIVIFLSNTILLVHVSFFYNVCLLLQLIIYSCAIIGWIKKGIGIGKACSLCYSFVNVNAAILCGWITYFKGKTYSKWAPERK